MNFKQYIKEQEDSPFDPISEHPGIWKKMKEFFERELLELIRISLNNNESLDREKYLYNLTNILKQNKSNIDKIKLILDYYNYPHFSSVPRRVWKYYDYLFTSQEDMDEMMDLFHNDFLLNLEKNLTPKEAERIINVIQDIIDVYL